MYVLSTEKKRVSNGREMSDDFLPPKSQTSKKTFNPDLMLAHRLRRRPDIKPTLIIIFIGIYNPVADPEAEEKGDTRGFSQFRGLIKVFGENRGGERTPARCA